MALGALTALGAVGNGVGQGFTDEQKLLQIIQAKNVLAGDKAYGNSLPGIFNAQVPGAQPMAGGAGQQPPQQPPMAPQGGQPPQAGGMRAMPQMAPPGAGGDPRMGGRPMMAPPQGTGGPAPGGMPQQGQPQGAMQPGGQQPQQSGPLSWQQIVQAVQRNNPGIKPEAMASAVDRYMPMMNQQSAMEWKQMMMQFRQQQEQGRDQRQQVSEQGKDQRQQTAEQGKTTRETTKEKAIQGRFDARQDKAVQVLSLQRQKLEQQIAATKDKSQLSQWRAILDAEHKKATEVIQANSVNSGMTDKQKKELMDENYKFYNDAIVKMRGLVGQSTPSGGTGEGPKTQDRAPQGSPNFRYDPGSGKLQPISPERGGSLNQPFRTAAEFQVPPGSNARGLNDSISVPITPGGPTLRSPDEPGRFGLPSSPFQMRQRFFKGPTGQDNQGAVAGETQVASNDIKPKDPGEAIQAALAAMSFEEQTDFLKRVKAGALDYMSAGATRKRRPPE